MARDVRVVVSEPCDGPCQGERCRRRPERCCDQCGCTGRKQREVTLAEFMALAAEDHGGDIAPLAGEIVDASLRRNRPEGE